METLRLLLNYMCLLCIPIVAASSGHHEDATCYSRYDFESKLLERSITIEHRMSLLEENTRKELSHVRTELRHMKREQSAKFQEMIKSIEMLQDKLEHRQNVKLEEMRKVGNDLKSTSDALVEMHQVEQDELEMRFENLSTTLQNDLAKRHGELIDELSEFKDAITSENEVKLEEMTSVKQDIIKLSEELQEDQSVKLKTVEAIGDEIKVEIQERMVKLEAESEEKKAEYKQIYQQFEEEVNNTWGEIKVAGLGIKPTVAFNIRDVMNTKPQSGDTLVFTYALTNTDSVYDISTGIFTAPVNGTYWFSVQLCASSNQQISFRIMVNNNVFSDSTTYPQGNTCMTSDAVAVLTNGDSVHAQVTHSLSRGYYYYSSLIQSTTYTRSAFMGALLH